MQSRRRQVVIFNLVQSRRRRTVFPNKLLFTVTTSGCCNNVVATFLTRDACWDITEHLYSTKTVLIAAPVMSGPGMTKTYRSIIIISINITKYFWVGEEGMGGECKDEFDTLQSTPFLYCSSKYTFSRKLFQENITCNIFPKKKESFIGNWVRNLVKRELFLARERYIQILISFIMVNVPKFYQPVSLLISCCLCRNESEIKKTVVNWESIEYGPVKFFRE